MILEFTDDARNVMQTAEEIGAASGYDEPNSLHILLALIRERCAVGWNVLRGLGCEMGELDAWIVERLRQSDNDGPAESEDRLTKSIVTQAQQLGHCYLGTEHILLGVLSEAESRAAQLLGEIDVTHEIVKVEVHKLLG